MSLLRSLDRTPAVSNVRHAIPHLDFLYPEALKKPQRRQFSKSTAHATPRLSRTGRSGNVENLFIRSLVQAGTCAKHARPIVTIRKTNSWKPVHHVASQEEGAATSEPGVTEPVVESQNGLPNPGANHGDGNPKVFFESASDQKHEAKELTEEQQGGLRRMRRFAKQELKALLDYYGPDDKPEEEEKPKETGLLQWITGDTHVPWELKDPAHQVHITRLGKLLQDDEASHSEIFDAYSQLPSPGVVYLTIGTIRSMMNHLAIVERPTPIARQRFLSILEDMKNAHIHILSSEWTTAIHLTGQGNGRVTEDDVLSAIYVWRDMEQRAGIKGNYVTLQVLFDTCVRAGKFDVAESFLREMQARKYTLNRHFRTSLIYYYGVMRDGSGVRKAYQDLVNEGDIVDTSVLNAVVAALLRAGEPTAAEHVFERMKRLHAERQLPAPGHRFYNRTWRDRRYLGLHLTKESRRLRRAQDHAAIKELQDYAPINPNARTYGLLIRHHAATMGDIDRVHALLGEMRYNGVAPDGTVFVVIFHGFAMFGGIKYSSWSRTHLEKHWAQYVAALHAQLDRTFWSSLAVVAALRAFAKVAGEQRTAEVWRQARELWGPNEGEVERVLSVLRTLFPKQIGFEQGLL